METGHPSTRVVETGLYSTVVADVIFSELNNKQAFAVVTSAIVYLLQ